MDGDTAVQLVREACYRLAERIKHYTPTSYTSADEYDSMLREEAGARFNSVARRMEHQIHWVLFEAGLDIAPINTGKWDKIKGWVDGKWVRVVTRDRYRPELIEDGLKRYEPHIRNLAVMEGRA